MSLINSLKSEHQAIKTLFSEVKSLGIETAEGQEKFNKAKSLLLAHLKKEDEQLYPALQKLVSEKKLAAEFQDEMQEISQDALVFFNHYSDLSSINAHEFSRDLGKFIGVLKNRIRKEEVTLYPKYEKHCL